MEKICRDSHCLFIFFTASNNDRAPRRISKVLSFFMLECHLIHARLPCSFAIQGLAEMRTFLDASGRQVHVVSIARRSRLHAGTRYLARGLNAAASTGGWGSMTACLPACLPACLLASQPACLLDRPPACLPHMAGRKAQGGERDTALLANQIMSHIILHCIKPWWLEEFLGSSLGK